MTSPPLPPTLSSCLDLLGAGGRPWLISFSLKTLIRTFRAALFDTQLENLRFQRLKTFLSNYCFCFAFPVSILKLKSWECSLSPFCPRRPVPWNAGHCCHGVVGWATGAGTGSPDQGDLGQYFKIRLHRATTRSNLVLGERWLEVWDASVIWTLLRGALQAPCSSWFYQLTLGKLCDLTSFCLSFHVCIVLPQAPRETPNMSQSQSTL